MSSFKQQKSTVGDNDVWGQPAAEIAMPWTAGVNSTGLNSWPEEFGKNAIEGGLKTLMPTPEEQKEKKDKTRLEVDKALGVVDHALALADPNFADDPAAAVEHQKALRVMSGMLNVHVPGTAEGTAQNEVSQAKFDEMVKLYMSIDTGKGDIQLSGTEDNPALYKSYAMEDIARIMQTESGRELVSALNDNTGGVKSDHHHVKTTIGEAFEDDGQGDKNKLTPKDQIPNPADYAKDHDQIGTASKIYYDSGQPFPVIKEEPWGNARSDVVLYHEMVHALHTSHGDAASIEDSKSEGGELIHAKEYQAAGLDAFADKTKNPFSENLYRMERLGVSADEQLNIPGSPELSDESMPQRLWYKHKPSAPLSTTASVGK